jgi:catechol 2,3-dioxygenase-like lactoylglutathione lyase family enzyme
MLEGARAVAVIPVHDLGKAQTFYEKMLGLKPLKGARPGGELLYSIGETELSVYATRAELGGATKVTVIVQDLKKEMGELRNHGITFEDFDVGDFKTTDGMAEDEYGKSAWFKDPEGNWIALAEPKS